MTTLYIICGLPFSGKSLLSKEIEKRTSIKRISFDDMWDAFDKSSSVTPYKTLLGIVEKNILDNLSEGISIIYDSTNLQLERRNKLKELAGKIGAQFQVIYLPVSKDEINRRRNLSLKDKTHHVVEDKDFNSAFDRLEPPTDCIIISNDIEKEKFLKSLES